MIKTYYYNHFQRNIQQDVDLSNISELLSSPDNLLWIDLYECSMNQFKYIGNLFGFHPLALEDCLQKSPRAKIDRYDNYNFFVFHALNYLENSIEGAITSIELDIFMGSNYIVTIHPVALAAVGKIAKLCTSTAEVMSRGPEYLLYSIVDNIIDDCFPVIERIGERIDDIEDSIFVKRGREITEEILYLKKTVILLRKVPIPQRRIFTIVNGHYSFLIDEDNIPYYADLIGNLDIIVESVNTYRDLLNSSTETYYSIITGRTSEIITILTIISIIMMPLTVITGFYGMNVCLPGENNPQAVWYILLGMVMLSLGMIISFKYRKWI